jgi:two-component system, chemotaxis family, protein-glutamate methylesterase/glutaminase
MTGLGTTQVAATQNQRPEDASSSAKPIRVMVADDSVVARVVARRALKAAPNIQVVAAAADGQSAINRLPTARPDVLILDIEMPIKSGLEALPELLALDPALKVVIVSSLTKRNADICMTALRAGASDVLAKPASNPDAVATFSAELCTKVLNLRSIPRPKQNSTGADAALTARPRPTTRASTHNWGEIAAIAIGSSTGGPQALTATLNKWSAQGATQPVFITQHMPPMFTRSLAEHIARVSGDIAREAVHGEVVDPGRIYLAPGDMHMQVADKHGAIRIMLNDGALVNFCRPSVDPMLMSLTEAYGSRLLTVILTGMGKDGLRGVEVAAAAGSSVIVQDEASRAVWGMPGAVANAGLAHEIIPIEFMADRLAELARGRRRHVA